LNTIEDGNENKSMSNVAKNKASQDVIVECEPSFEDAEDHTQDPTTTFNKTDTKFQSLKEEDLKHDIEANMNKIMKARTYNSIQSAQELEKSQVKCMPESLKGIPGDGLNQTGNAQTRSYIGIYQYLNIHLI